jgi:adenylate cyclase
MQEGTQVRQQTVWTRLRSPLFAALLVSILVWLGILGLRAARYLEALELAAYDWCLRLRPDIAHTDARVALIAITESDIQQLGTWPLSDATLADALAHLLEHGPRAIGLDIYRDVPVPPGHDTLTALLSSQPRIITVMKFGTSAETSVLPPPVLRHTEQVGFNDFTIDPGGIVRRGLLYLDHADTTFSSLALRLALLYLQADGIGPQPDPTHPEYLRLGRTTIRPFEANDGGYVGADAGGYQFLLDFRDLSRGFPTFSLAALLADEVDPAALRDKVVLVGVTAVSVKDTFFTPYSRGRAADLQLPGIALHAHSVSQLLRGALEGHATITTSSDRQEALWILLWCLLGASLGYRVRGPWQFTLAGAGSLGVLTATGYGALLSGWWIPVVPPALAWGLSAALVTAYMSYQEKAERQLLMRLFSQYVSAEFAETIWQERQQFLTGGRPHPQRLTATVLFTDLEGFTSVSEGRAPQDLLDWLNAYMEVMVQQIMARGGVINKYIGDAIMALFGVPLPHTSEVEIRQDAVNAVESALAMEKALCELNRRWQAQGLPTIGMRVGIFTGPLVVGSLGGTQRLEYTVLGDTVNTASRLESFDKHVFAPHTTGSPCRILIGESTLQYLGGRFETQKVGRVRLTGKEEHVTIYRVIARLDGSEHDPSEEKPT